MKTKKHFLVCLVLTVFMVSLCVLPAFAESNATSEITYFEDGSYLTVETVVYSRPWAKGSNSVSGTKTSVYRSSEGVLLWDFTVHGTFTYNGSTATATKATYSYNIYDSAWTLKSANAYCSGSQAIGEATFNGGLLLNRSTSVTLSCSGSGALS